MTNEKWKQIAKSEFNKYVGFNTSELTPEMWEKERDKMLYVIKQLDELTEVYNMENKVQK